MQTRIKILQSSLVEEKVFSVQQKLDQGLRMNLFVN